MCGNGLQIYVVIAFLNVLLLTRSQTTTARYGGKKGKKVKQSSISKTFVHIGVKIIWIVGQRKVSIGRQL